MHKKSVKANCSISWKIHATNRINRIVIRMHRHQFRLRTVSKRRTTHNERRKSSEFTKQENFEIK